ncbi:hypothetical protein Acor_36770 [Acrocarpospora corrugata]|uniref:Uncharacterized protein n=1 Tax=Acrocarpospora corrugata TaxID=35763 RepID=A0A5M3W2S5_9ACTN|nr:hypothetical protein [Acrocarpospora corrugata]GES01613.1 hypothetical protein Acor_36770 [Acrocarpospora corrugata]
MVQEDQAARPPWFRSLPLWFRLLGLPIAVAITYGMYQARGLPMAIVAGAVYGGLALALLWWKQTLAWSAAHPLLDSLAAAPVMFVSLATLTDLPLLLCGIGAVAVASVLVLVNYRRLRRKA